jgi:hypothetical protein
MIRFHSIDAGYEDAVQSLPLASPLLISRRRPLMAFANQGEKPQMNKFLLPLALVLVAGVAVAQADTKPADKASVKTTASEKTAAPAKAATKTHVVEGEVVSADATAKTITVKVAGEDKTVPVHGKAAARLSSLKAGEKVALTCVDNEKGEHQYVSGIKVEKAAATTAAPAKTTAKGKKPSSK